MSLLRDYAASIAQPTLPLTGNGVRFDEVVGADGALRPAWKGMASIAVELTSAELGRIDAEITTLLADDGATYGNPDGAQPWQLDPMPLVLDAATCAGRCPPATADTAQPRNHRSRCHCMCRTPER